MTEEQVVRAEAIADALREDGKTIYEEQLDYLIQLHADYHSGKPGLNDDTFKKELLGLMRRYNDRQR